MEAVLNEIRTQLQLLTGNTAERIEKIQQSGSDRVYFRIYHAKGTTIATYNQHLKENETFLYFSRHFKKSGVTGSGNIWTKPCRQSLFSGRFRSGFIVELFGAGWV